MNAIPQKGLGTAEIPLWPHLNMLDSPGLQHVVAGVNDSIADKPEYVLDSLVALSKPSMYPYLTPVTPGSLVNFQGTAYTPDNFDGSQATIAGAEFLDISYRRLGGLWRIVFALTAEPDDAKTTNLHPPYIDVDPLERGNALFAQENPADVTKGLVSDLNTMAKLSMRYFRGIGHTPAVVQRLRNDLATEAARICDADIALKDYLLSIRSRERYFALNGRHASPVREIPDIDAPVGTYTDMKFLGDLVDPQTLRDLPPEDTDVPSIILTTTSRQRFAYPLARLAAVELLSFQAAPGISS